jgi:hypothetical protein
MTETIGLLIVLFAGLFMFFAASVNPKNIMRTLFPRVAFAMLGLGGVVIALANLAGIV